MLQRAPILALAILLPAFAAPAGTTAPTPAAPARAARPAVVSFSPGITQILFDLGLGDHVVGVTRFCRLPAGVVKPRIGDALDISAEAILAVKPDIILTQTGAGRFRGVTDVDPHVRVEQITIETLDDVHRAIERIARLLGRDDLASRKAGEFAAALDAARAKVAGLSRPRVIFVMGTDRPVVAAGDSFIGDLVKVAGGVNAGDDIPGTTRWRATHIDAIAAARPDVLLCLQEGPDAQAAYRYWLQWRDLPAARAGRVFVLTDPTWTIPGTHLAGKARDLADMIHSPPAAISALGPAPAPSLTLWHARLLRLLAAAIVGAALGVAGMALQGLLRNPLAEPYILGVSSGAGVGVLLGLAASAALAVPAWLSTPLLAFGGALATCAAVYLVAQRRGRLDPYALILSGVIVNTFNGAIMLTIYLYVDPHRIADFAHWAMGRLPDAIDLNLLLVCGGLVLAGWGLLLACAGAYNVLGLGDAVAASSGVAVQRLRLATFACAAVMTAAAVALAGPIGFLGLIVPHLVRMTFGADHRLGLLAAGFAGAALLVGAELLCRAAGPLIGVSLIPVGILTALAGGPFFIVLLRRRLAEVTP